MKEMRRLSCSLLDWPLLRRSFLLIAAVSVSLSAIVGIPPAQAQQLTEISISDLLKLPSAGGLQTAQNEYGPDASLVNDPGNNVLGLDISTPAVVRRGSATIMEFPIPYLNKPAANAAPCMPGMPSDPGSTHEITFDQNGGTVLWVTGQNYDTLVKVSLNGQLQLYSLPSGSGPHGIAFDAAGQLWVTLEFSGKIAKIDDNGNIVAEYDANLVCTTCPQPINTHPHGLGIGSDGATVWYTGKATGTVGRVMPDGEVENYALKNVGSVPIYIKAGPDGNMWVTELVGNAIARVTPEGSVTEFPIPTLNSRPIAIVPEPDGKAMWFSEEASDKVGRITFDGTITEYQVPKRQRNVILAALWFDNKGNLWTQQYVDENNPRPKGPDYIVRIDKSIVTTDPSRIGKIPITFYAVPTRQTVMHRIIQGPDQAMWFTELFANKVGRLVPK
jgi:virginiamycin B lyase